MIDFNKEKVVPIHKGDKDTSLTSLFSQDLDAERLLLSSVLVNGETLTKIEDTLKPEDFYQTTHRIIYSAFLSLKANGHKPDIVTTADELEKQGNLKSIGGAAMLSRLSDEAPLFLNMEGHARIIKECSIKRKMAAIGHKLIDQGLLNKSVLDLLSFAKIELEKIQAPTLNNGSRFQLKRLSEIEFKAPDWLIEPFIEKDTLIMFFGDPASTKTFGAIDTACSVATGKDFHGMKVLPGPVVYIAGEGQNGLKRRFMAWAKHHDCNLDDAPIYLSLMPAALCDQEQTGWVMDAIKQISKDCGEPALIVLDTVARNFGPGDENSTMDMNGFIKGADLIREQYKACILLVHHTGHGDKSRGRGAMALKGALDSEYRFEKDDQGVVRVTNTKMKDFAPPDPMAFRLTTVELPFKDQDGNFITSAVLDDTTYEPPATQGKNGRGKWQTVAIEILQNLYQKHRDRLEAKGYDPDEARVTTNDWRIACIEKGMTRQAWYRVKDTLPQTREVNLEGDYVYLK